ncbi:MAG: hypothetical protein ACXVEE_25585 [Polyangiales bacterium]
MKTLCVSACLLLVTATARAEEERELGFGAGAAVGADLSFHVGVWKEAFAIGQWKPRGVPVVVRFEPGIAHIGGTTTSYGVSGGTNFTYEEDQSNTIVFARGLIGADLSPVTILAGGSVGYGKGSVSSYLCEGSTSGVVDGFLFEANVRIVKGLELGARSDFYWKPHGIQTTYCSPTTHGPAADEHATALLSFRIAYLFD